VQDFKVHERQDRTIIETTFLPLADVEPRVAKLRQGTHIGRQPKTVDRDVRKAVRRWDLRITVLFYEMDHDGIQKALMITEALLWLTDLIPWYPTLLSVLHHRLILNFSVPDLLQFLAIFLWIARHEPPYSYWRYEYPIV
jgi:hypothetical protein